MEFVVDFGNVLVEELIVDIARDTGKLEDIVGELGMTRRSLGGGTGSKR